MNINRTTTNGLAPQHAARRDDSDRLECIHSQIQSKKDLAALCEVTDVETGTFQRCTFTYFDKDDSAWFGQTPGIRKHNLTVEDIRASLEKVPDERIYPVATPLITLAPNLDRSDIFIKRPQVLHLDDEEETKLLPQILIEEADILELIKRRPHSNLVRYYGCNVKRGRVTGIVLQRHQAILQYRYEDDERDFDIRACMRGIRAGIEHLHSLGLAHNDLNPMNIALDTQDRPVILDFGSCRPFGEKLLSAGTPGWIDELYDVSSAKHDESAIEKLDVWLKGKQSERETLNIPL